MSAATQSPAARGDLVHAFDAPHPPGTDLVALLGGKGAGLAEMTALLGLPVPPGFTVSVEACRHVLAGSWPAGLDREIGEHLAALEARTGRQFGGDRSPLLVSVRSGAPISMPGMLDTVLDVGLNDATVEAFADETGDARFAYDCYRRLVAMFGSTVLGVPREAFDDATEAARARAGVLREADLSADDVRALAVANLAVVQEATGEPFPQDPRRQLRLAAEAVFQSWTSARAVTYRRVEGISEALGTAVTVQAMVFGNRGERSGSGVAFSRDPATGAPGLTGDWLDRAQGEDVVAGTHQTLPLSELAQRLPGAHAELVRAAALCEQRSRDLVDMEFTVEDGRMWLLQTRVGRRAPAASVRVAVDLVVEEARIAPVEAVQRVAPATLQQLLADAGAGLGTTPVASGLAASPGLATGQACFSADDALDADDRGETVILVRPETSPEDVHGMAVAVGILTARGGLVSHAAVVARAWGKPAVVGVESLEIGDRSCTIGGHTVAEGDVLSIDGATGAVYLGEVDRVASALPPEVATLTDLADAVRGPAVTVHAVDDGGPPAGSGWTTYRLADAPAEPRVGTPAADAGQLVLDAGDGFADRPDAVERARTAAWALRSARPDVRLGLVGAPPADESWADIVVELGIGEVWCATADRPLLSLALARAVTRAVG